MPRHYHRFHIRDKLTEFLTDASIPIYYQMHGVGTVSSDFLNLCGLGDTHKTIMLCIVPKERTRMLLAEMNQALQLHKRGTGIAVSIPLSGIQGWLYKVLGFRFFGLLRTGDRKRGEKNE